MKCLFCNAEFVKKAMTRRRQKYCSDKCRKGDFYLNSLSSNGLGGRGLGKRVNSPRSCSDREIA